MKQRSALKQASLQRILKSGAVRLCEEGLSGAVIASVMKDAGLTHGTFYSHFSNKDELLVASLQQALVENRPWWIHSKKNEPWAKRLEQLAQRYLTAEHRDNLSNSCALAALVSETARSSPEFRHAYEVELKKTIAAICGNNPYDTGIDSKLFKETVLFLALCIGGLSLSRAVKANEFSDQILAICRSAPECIVNEARTVAKKGLSDSHDHVKFMDESLELDQYPATTFEKLRYADTDREGHVKSTVFSALFETGCVEILNNPDAPLASPCCTFVIACQAINFYSEINWPGLVDIGTRVSQVGLSSVTFEQALFQNGRKPATAKTVIVQSNETTKQSEPLNDAAIERLNWLKSS